MIKIDLATDFVPEGVVIPDEALEQAARDIMEAARAYWVQLAGERLGSSRRAYQDAIQPVESGPGWLSVTLVGNLPTMLEEGMSAYDMHDTLLGPNVPVVTGPGQRGKRMNAQGGFYRAIPFRHQTPGTSGQGGGAPMGSQYFKQLPTSLAGKMQQELGEQVHAAAKKLSATTGMPGGATKWGSRLPAGVGGVGKLRPHHSTDIYAGMVRQSKTYAQATQNTYTTFRTISTNVKDKWLHPGIQAVNLLDDVEKYVNEIAESVLQTLVGGGT